jgi:hypothetical protein
MKGWATYLAFAGWRRYLFVTVLAHTAKNPINAGSRYLSSFVNLRSFTWKMDGRMRNWLTLEGARALSKLTKLESLRIIGDWVSQL